VSALLAATLELVSVLLMSLLAPPMDSAAGGLGAVLISDLVLLAAARELVDPKGADRAFVPCCTLLLLLVVALPLRDPTLLLVLLRVLEVEVTAAGLSAWLAMLPCRLLAGRLRAFLMLALTLCPTKRPKASAGCLHRPKNFARSKIDTAAAADHNSRRQAHKPVQCKPPSTQIDWDPLLQECCSLLCSRERLGKHGCKAAQAC